MRIDYAASKHPAFEIGQEALSLAIIELNSMSPCDSVIMTRTGEVKAGYAQDAGTLCTLIPAGILARQLTADGLSSYSGKELRKWADSYDSGPLQVRVDAAMQQWLDGMVRTGEVLPLLQLFPEVAHAELSGDGAITLTAREGEELSETARAWVAACAQR